MARPKLMIGGQWAVFERAPKLRAARMCPHVRGRAHWRECNK